MFVSIIKITEISPTYDADKKYFECILRESARDMFRKIDKDQLKQQS